MLTNDQKATLISLQDYLTRIAHNIVRTHWPQTDPEDVLAQMNLAIAEKTEEDPAFLQQSPGYITKAAAWEARHWCRHTFTRYHRGQRIARAISLERDYDEDNRPANEVYAAPESDNDIAIDIRTALASLDEVGFQIAQMRLAGWRRRDIAEAMGTSSQNISRHMHKIEAALKPVWQAVTGEPEGPRQLSFGL